jgi:hypothetical protein
LKIKKPSSSRKIAWRTTRIFLYSTGMGCIIAKFRGKYGVPSRDIIKKDLREPEMNSSYPRSEAS